MPATSGHALPYPAATDVPDIPYHMQQLAEGVETALTADPGQRCALLKSANQSIANGTEVDVTWETESSDTGGWHAANSADVVVPANAVYAASVVVQWDSTATTEAEEMRVIKILVDGKLAAFDGGIESTGVINNNAGSSSCSWVGYAAAGQVIKVVAWQNTDAALNIEAHDTIDRRTAFQVCRLSSIF